MNASYRAASRATWSSIEFGNHRPGWIKETLKCIYIYICIHVHGRFPIPVLHCSLQYIYIYINHWWDILTLTCFCYWHHFVNPLPPKKKDFVCFVIIAGNCIFVVPLNPARRNQRRVQHQLIIPLWCLQTALLGPLKRLLGHWIFFLDGGDVGFILIYCTNNLAGFLKHVFFAGHHGYFAGKPWKPTTCSFL